MTAETASVAETEAVAADLAATLTGGTVITLDGDLGAGKTQFVRGLVRGLGGDPRSVSSPTFVLLNVYDTGRLKVFHLDAYRTAGEEDFETVGFGELLEQDGLVVVEWPQRIAGLIPAGAIRVQITPVGPTERVIDIRR